jgi:addiction module HigA family antidote
MPINRTRKPTHPGALLAEILPDSKIKHQGQLAELMGVSRRLVNEIINERRPVTTDVAFRLAAVFDTSADLWLRMQVAFDVWEAQQLKAKVAAYTQIRERASKIAA